MPVVTTMTRSTFNDLVSEFSDVVADFNRQPLSKKQFRSLYWREVIVQGFCEDFESMGYRLRYVLRSDGVIEHWHTSPICYKGGFNYAG